MSHLLKFIIPALPAAICMLEALPAACLPPSDVNLSTGQHRRHPQEHKEVRVVVRLKSEQLETSQDLTAWAAGDQWLHHQQYLMKRSRTMMVGWNAGRTR